MEKQVILNKLDEINRENITGLFFFLHNLLFFFLQISSQFITKQINSPNYRENWRK